MIESMELAERQNMEIETLELDPCLEGLVQSIVLRRNPQGQRSWRVFIPSNYGIIASYYGNSIEEYSSQGMVRLSTPTLFGLQTLPKYLKDFQPYEAVLVYLTPYGLAVLTGKDAPTLVDRRENLPYILQDWFPGWDNRDWDFVSLSLEEKAQRIQLALVEYFKGKKGPSVLQKALGIIEESQGEISIQDLCSQLEITRQGLAYFSKRYMGISLKVYTRIERLKRALNLIEQGLSWSKVVDQCGFFDYSHLTKEIKSFTSMKVAQVKNLLNMDRTEITRFFNKQVNCHFFYLPETPDFAEKEI